MPGAFPILMGIALLCFIVAGFGGIFYHPDARPYSIGWFGAFFACLALLIGQGR
jgi:hypothetical protein